MAQAASVYVKGEHILVWSNSRGEWMPGIVEEAPLCPTVIDGYEVPAGAVKVHSSAGLKWVYPDQIATVIRRTDTGGATAACKQVDGRGQIWHKAATPDAQLAPMAAPPVPTQSVVRAVENRSDNLTQYSLQLLNDRNYSEILALLAAKPWIAEELEQHGVVIRPPVEMR